MASNLLKGFSLNLSDAKPGQLLQIISIKESEAESQMIRMGLGIGDLISCLTRIPGGPTVIKRGSVEVALGKELSESIGVQLMNIKAEAS